MFLMAFFKTGKGESGDGMMGCFGVRLQANLVIFLGSYANLRTSALGNRFLRIFADEMMKKQLLALFRLLCF